MKFSFAIFIVNLSVGQVPTIRHWPTAACTHNPPLAHCAAGTHNPALANCAAGTHNPPLAHCAACTHNPPLAHCAAGTHNPPLANCAAGTHNPPLAPCAAGTHNPPLAYSHDTVKLCVWFTDVMDQWWRYPKVVSATLVCGRSAWPDGIDRGCR